MWIISTHRISSKYLEYCNHEMWKMLLNSYVNGKLKTKVNYTKMSPGWIQLGSSC